MRKTATVSLFIFYCLISLSTTAQIKRFDLIIDEVMADPTPVVGLPNAEYIEIKNVSGRAINLQGLRVTTGSSQSGLFPLYTLPSDEYLVITSTANAPSFASYGRVLGITSFPALDNNGATVSIVGQGVTVHSVSYNISWYNNAVKSEGGWSLEMIDTRSPCSGAENWKASVDARGGTPGSKNSADAPNPDKTAPAVVRATGLDSVTVLLTFTEPVDSLKAATTANYLITDGVNIVSAITIPPTFNKVQLALASPLVRSKVYSITINNVSDCAGNVIQAVNTTRLGLASQIDSFGIVVNEILFNPKPNAVDYLEIYNRSSKVYDLKDLYIANRSSTTNAVASVRQVTTENLLLFPGDYFVLTENSVLVKQNYAAQNPANFIDLSSMPSFPDDRGVAVLLNARGQIIDELRYDKKWHFSLIDNDEGISLERIDYNKPTQDQNNWHSASSTVGFGTPSYQNSQFRLDAVLQGEVTIAPKVFSPDNDGFDDFAILKYQLTSAGYVANITIFDAAGRPVKNLAKNATLAATGSFRWDGLDDKLRKVPVGTYIVYTEVFNLAGNKRSFKNTVVVAARF
jgi:hypothetical protein